MIIAVTGMTREARLIAHPRLMPVIGGGDAARLEERIADMIVKGGRRILSIGICGALCPGLKIGDVVIASEVVAADGLYPTSAPWTRELAMRVPHAVVASVAGVDQVSGDCDGKADLRATTKARVVDMESHVAARAAVAHGLPFAAVRVVSDGAHRTLPHAAQVAFHPSGGVDVRAMVHSILRAPRQILPLIRTAWEAEIAFAALFRCCGMLHGGFARSNFGELALDVA